MKTFDDPSSRGDSSDPQRRAALVRRVVEDCMIRRSAGDRLTDEEIASSHADLMPELGEELALLSVIERARWTASSITREAALDAGLDAGSRGEGTSDISKLLSFRGYTIEREIHRGGQGVVYKAVQRSTQRPVAVKVLHENQIGDRRDAARFEREARILGLLNHPNVVKIHDTGVIAGRRYLAMDLIQGQPWDRHEGAAGEATRDVRAAAERFATICDAVNAAHLRGIIHRDLKPGNILIDETGVPHVLDFGLAKLTESSTTDVVTMTAEGQFIGSLPWASPEQAAGQSELLDVRSDVYSLGVMFYQVLTGAFPYNVKGPWRTVADTILQTEPKRPRAHRPDLDADLEKILLKCLAKNAGQRYQSAGELAADVRRYLSGEPVEARGGSTIYVLARLARKHRIAVAVATAFLLLITAGGIVTTVLYQRERVALADATQEKKKANEATQKAEAVSDFLTSMLASPNPMEAGKDVKVAEILKTSADTVGEKFAGQPHLQATIRDIIGQTYHNLGMLNESEVQLREALSIRTNLLGEESVETCDTKMNLSATLWVMGGKLEEAESLARAALTFFERTEGEEGDNTIGAGQLLGAILNARGRPEEVLPLKQKSYEVCLRKYGESDLKTIEALGNIAFTLDRAEHNEEAEEIYLKVLELSRKHVGPESETTIAYEISYANLIRAMGRPAEAEPFVRHALEVGRKILPPGHPKIGDCLSEIGSIQVFRGEYKEALKSYREALEIQSAALGADSWRTAGVRLYVAGILTQLEQFEESEEELETAFVVLEKSWGEHQPVEFGFKQVATNLYAAWKKPDKAAEWQKRLHAVCARAFGEEDRRTIEALRNVAGALKRAEQFGEAEEVFDQALALSRRVAGTDDELSTAIEQNYSSFLRSRERPAEAEPLIRHVLEVSRRVLPPGDIKIGECLSELGGALAEQGEFDGAERSFRESFQIHSAALGEDDWRTVDVRLFLTRTLAGLERYEDAEKELEASFAVLKNTWGEHPSVEQELSEVAKNLFTAWEKHDKVAEWTQRIDEINSAIASKPSMPGIDESAESKHD